MRKTGNEPITFRGKDTGYRLVDFWSWGFSDLLDNTLRGSYAEFIVAAALDVDLSAARSSWGAWDLTTPDGIKVEVKSSSYLQSWEQTRPADIKFSIRPALSWSAGAGWSSDRGRSADVYVFCVFTDREATSADLTRMDRWEFYVLPTRTLEERCGAQKTIILRSLLKLDPVKTDFAGLKAAVLQSV